MRLLQAFLTFFLDRHAAADTLRELCAADLVAWVEQVRRETNRFGKLRSPGDVAYHVAATQRLVRYLQRTDSPSAPSRPIEKIYLPDLLPPLPRGDDRSRIKYLPELVLQQIDAHIEAFENAYLPILMVLRASGWRISDVLTLRYDTCLDGEGERWSLVGDIHKTCVLGHRVPITSNVAAVIRVQAALVRAAFSDYDNPKRYLFPSPHPRRLGRSGWRTSARR